MNKFATSLIAKPHATVPTEIWDRFASEHPRCSAEILLSNPRLKAQTLSAVMMASIFEQIVCWQQFNTIYDIYQSLAICSRDRALPIQAKSFLLEIIKIFNTIFQNLKPFDKTKLQSLQSQTRKSEIVAEYLQASRQFIYGKLTSDEGIEALALLSKGIALSLYLRPDFDQHVAVKRFVQRKSRDEIVRELIMGAAVDPKNYFILEDYELVAVSHLLNIPIHFFINYYEKGQQTLTKRRIHATLNEEKTVSFLMDFSSQSHVAQSVRILYYHHDSAYIRHILTNDPQLNLGTQSEQVLQYLHTFFESTINATIQQCTEINQFWIKKIIQILESGEAETLVSKRIQGNMPDHLLQTLAAFFNQCSISKEDCNGFTQAIMTVFNSAVQLFENIVISQVTNIRDSIGGKIKKINQQTSNPPSIIQSEPPHSRIHPQLPSKPKILSTSSLFQNQSGVPTNKAFLQQKSLSEQGRIEAKQIDQDIPDVRENYSDDVQIPQTQIVQAMEYQTSSSDEEKKCFPNYNDILTNSIRKQSSLIESQQPLRPPKYPDFQNPNQYNSDTQSYKEPTKQRGSESVLYKSVNSLQESKSSDDTLNFNPNVSRKSVNIQNKMSQSQQMRGSVRSVILSQTEIPQKNEEEMLRSRFSKISEVDESKCEFQSQLLLYECPICYLNIRDPNDVRTLHGDHKMCRNCLETWIKVKFNAGQWNFKFFRCPISTTKSASCDHIIDQNEIKEALTDEEYRRLCEKAMKSGIIDITCPYDTCGVNIRGMPPKSKEGLMCPDCKQKICWVCKNKDHQGVKCPQRIDEIKIALQDERVSCCPECLEIYMKNDGCEHVQCTNCLIDFCFACCAPRLPIEGHGAHYHREGCQWRDPWIDPRTKKEILENEYDPRGCEACRKSQQPCIRPLALKDFCNLAYLNF